MNKTIYAIFLLSSIMAFTQPDMMQQTQGQGLNQGILGQQLIIQQGQQQQQNQYNPIDESPYIQPQNPIYPGNVIIQSGISLQEMNQSLNSLQVLYYGLYRIDPNIRYFRKPADRVVLIISYRLNNSVKYIGYEASYDELLNQGQRWAFAQVIQSFDRMLVYQTLNVGIQQGQSFNAYRDLQMFLSNNKTFQQIIKAYQNNSSNNTQQYRENNTYSQLYPAQVLGTVFEYLINLGINYQSLRVLNVSNDNQGIYNYVFEMQINRQTKYMGAKLRQNGQIEIISVVIEDNLQQLLDYYGLQAYDQSFTQFYNAAFYQSKNLPLWQKLQMTMSSQQYGNQQQMNNQYNNNQYQYGQQRPQQQQPPFQMFGQQAFLLGSSAPEETIEAEEKAEEKKE